MKKSPEQKIKMYQRYFDQIGEHMEKTTDIVSKMSTIIAVLHNKIPYYFWTGFYFYSGDNLTVGPYQGSLACLTLPKPKGVCWKSFLDNKSIIIDDVHSFPDHIACDARSKSEIVIPVHNKSGHIYAVMDIDSNQNSMFDEIDRRGLEKITDAFLILDPSQISTGFISRSSAI